MFQTRVAEKIKAHFLCSRNTFSKIRAVYEIMGKNMIGPDCSQMTT